mmetsp:Transcript_114366/g.363427  ORF Transcript_114366/g.363427 Transcript_114366/m.363427 type:complete len:216 (+) Transcript_114366:1512-2159(+)
MSAIPEADVSQSTTTFPHGSLPKSPKQVSRHRHGGPREHVEEDRPRSRATARVLWPPGRRRRRALPWPRPQRAARPSRARHVCKKTARGTSAATLGAQTAEATTGIPGRKTPRFWWLPDAVFSFSRALSSRPRPSAPAPPSRSCKPKPGASWRPPMPVKRSFLTPLAAASEAPCPGESRACGTELGPRRPQRRRPTLRRHRPVPGDATPRSSRAA